MSDWDYSLVWRDIAIAMDKNSESNQLIKIEEGMIFNVPIDKIEKPKCGSCYTLWNDGIFHPLMFVDSYYKSHGKFTITEIHTVNKKWWQFCKRRKIVSVDLKCVEI